MARKASEVLVALLFTTAVSMVGGVAEAAVTPPWTSADVGAVGFAGNSSESGGQFAVYGSGADIWGSADAFHYVHQRLNGNTQIVAKVTSVLATHPWAKAGVMIREDLSPGSRHAFVCLTPANGVAFQSRAAPGGSSSSASVTGVAAPRWVKLARSGDRFTAYHSADGVSWSVVGSTRILGMAPVVYVGLAATSHDNTRLGSASFTNVALNAPPALLVVRSTLLNSGDAAIKKRLEGLGYSLTIKTDSAATSADANGKDLVFISSTVSSSTVGTKFTSAAVPVITAEENLLDDLGMTGAVSGTDFGFTTGQTETTIFGSACDRKTMYTSAKGFADGCHDMTATLSGTHPVARQPVSVKWGKPGSSAVKIAHVVGNTGRTMVFGYERGAAMPRLAAAPARRVFLFLDDTSAASWTGKGQSLFDGAVYWATSTRYYTTKKVLLLNYDPVLHTQGNVRMHEYGSQRWPWLFIGDPLAFARDVLADLSESSGGYVRWKLAKYAGIPDYIDRWVPITASVQFDTPEFTEQRFLTGYEQGPELGRWIEAGQSMPDGGNYSADYHRILDDFGVDAKVTAGEVDEVIVSHHPFAGLWESAMAGSNPYFINGGIYFRNTRNFVVMGQSYERRHSEALENYGHRVEWQVSRAFFGFQETLPYNACYWPDFDPSCGVRQPTPQRNIYDIFVVVDGNLPGQAGVGAAHWAPNAQSRSHEYRWDLTNTVYTMADDWQFNYPNLVGASTRRLVNDAEWRPMAQDFEAGRGFKKWWYHHFPRLPGHYRDPNNATNNGKLNNWWEYIVNFDRHPESR